jgi:tRNA-specific adenosine deaminase 3
MALAEAMGAEACSLGRGRAVGVVIADTDIAAKDGGGNGIVAVAGDARYWPPNNATRTGEIDGRPEHHAVMRAISLIAQLRLSPSSPSSAITPTLSHLESAFLSPTNPITAGLSSSTYLCTNLSIYVSHEPCTCCAMAILHSRFRNVVFRRRMNGSGGLTAESGREERDEDSEAEEEVGGVAGNEGVVRGRQREGRGRKGLGYGLFWRRELNWRCLGWEFATPDLADEEVGEVFNA